MTLQDLRIRFFQLLSANDVEGIRVLLTEHPEMLRSTECAAAMMHSAAQAGNVALVALLAERGVDVNIPHDPEVPSLPIDSAMLADMGLPSSVRPRTAHDPLPSSSSYSRALETVRWLIEHGSKVNRSWHGSPPYCSALNTAIRTGRLKLVRLLVEARAELNVIGLANRTPLTWAIEYGQTEIADYLRSKGALEAHQVPGYVSPESKGPIVAYVESKICPTNRLAWLPIIPDEVPVSIHAVFDENNYCLFTQGMSSRPMTVPAGGERYQYAELVLYLNDWDTDVKTWQTPDKVWVINWMRRIAQYPFEHNTWLGGKIAIIANEDPPEPLSEFTPMTCWLLLGERKPPLQRVELPDGRSVVFYAMMPIHTAERDFERQHGMLALLRRFEEHETPLCLDPNRESVV